ncbi:MAG: DUF3857 domain-containing protein [Balneola sp.]|nr:MAG: DUF3857 domain-containing protein [Balneola sp.]
MNKLKIIVLLLLVLGCSSTKRSVDIGYGDYSSTDLRLALNAHSTVRLSNTTLDVISPSKALYKVQKAVTIYDKDDKDLAVVYLPYDDFISINYLVANIRDNTGRVIRSFSLGDAGDYSASGGDFFSDNRMKILEMPYNKFPYSIEYEFELEYNGLLGLPGWWPQLIGQSVEEANFTLIDRGNTGVRFYNKNIDEEPIITETQTAKTYSWSIKNSEAIEREVLGPPSSELLPMVEVAPGKFEMEQTTGNATTWKSFGKWYYELSKDTRELPEEAKKEVDELIAGISSEKEKVKILFDYLQDRSRYVSIQLGIGGWKPFTADYVFDNSYGDCKALTNYMHAMLEYAGIKAESVLIYRGINEQFMNVDFPSNQFNHVILKVTLESGEVIWLECTSKYYPPNHIGPDNEGKYALLITEEGGEVIETPSYEYSANLSQTKLHVKVEEDGTTIIENKTKREGILQDYLLMEVLPVSEKEREEWIESQIDVDNTNIIEYSFDEVNSSDDFSIFSFKARLGNYTQASNKRIFVPVNKMNRWFFGLDDDEEREQSLYLPYTFMESDSIIFETPEGFSIESAPADVEYTNEFGEFTADFEVLGEGKMGYFRTFSITEKMIEPESYNDLKDFFDKVRYADRQQFVLVRD